MWVGVGLAFFVQTLIAVLAGGLVTLLPDQVVKGVASLIFLAGASSCSGRRPRPTPRSRPRRRSTPSGPPTTAPGCVAVGASFLVLFAAEWGDLSQLLTISLIAHYGHPASVFIGAWGALLVVSGLAVVVGRVLLNHVRLSVIHYVGSAVCLVLAAVTGFQLITG